MAETITEKKGIIYKVPEWTVPGVSYRGQIGTYKVIGEMTPAKTQDELVSKYGVEIPSAPLLLAIATRACDLREENPGEVESLMAFLRRGLRMYPNTSSRVIYSAHGVGKDEVIHDYGTPEEYFGRGNFTDRSGFIGKLNIMDGSVLESVLGTRDVEGINNVSQWINGTKVYLLRLSKPSKQKGERVVGFFAYAAWLYLDCDGVPYGRSPGFRVEPVSQDSL